MSESAAKKERAWYERGHFKDADEIRAACRDVEGRRRRYASQWPKDMATLVFFDECLSDLRAAYCAWRTAMSEWVGEQTVRCDHEAGRHVQPLVLVAWREGDLITGITQYVRLACFACGKRWTEEA